MHRHELCTTLEKYLAAVEAVGISQDDVAEIVEAAAFIKGKATSRVERLVSPSEQEVD